MFRSQSRIRVGIPADVIDKIFDPFFTTKDVDMRRGWAIDRIRDNRTTEDIYTWKARPARALNYRLPARNPNQNRAGIEI
jgi:hypothetical protein